MARTDPQLKLRLPAELKAWVEECAEKNQRSLNAEIVHILTSSRDRGENKVGADRPRSVRALIDQIEELSEELQLFNKLCDEGKKYE